MSDLVDARVLLASGQLAVTVVRSDGEILYENRFARDLFGHESPAGSVVPSLSVPSSWDDVLGKVTGRMLLEDEPVLVRTPHGEAELCYLTVFPQYNEQRQLECLVCAWAARKHALAWPSAAPDTGTLSEYVHSLEGLIEHRAYQQMLAAERNEQAREALEVLPVGVIVATASGDVVYRNLAMSDQFGLRLSECPEPNVRHFLSPPLREAFTRAAASGMRAHHLSCDPGGRRAAADFLPLLKGDKVQHVVIQFSRVDAEGPSA